MRSAATVTSPDRANQRPRRVVALLVAVVLLWLHMAGEALHYRAHLPTHTVAASDRGERVPHAERFSRTSEICRQAPAIEAADDDCAFCKLSSLAGSATCTCDPVPLSVGIEFVSAAQVLTLVACHPIRPHAPGPSRAPPSSFV